MSSAELKSSFWVRARERGKFLILKTSDWLETDLATRIFVALLYFPALLLSTYWPEAFGFFMGLVLFGSWYEYLSFKKKPTNQTAKVETLLMAALFSLPAIFMILRLPVGLSVPVYLLLGQYSWYRSMKEGLSLKEWWDENAFYLFGLLYITGLFSLIFVMFSYPGGQQAVWFLLLVVGATDTMAYFVGRKMGKTPFFQNISPKKTLEGFWGGVSGGVLAAVVFSLVLRHFEHNVPNVWISIILGGAVALVSVFGDLFESQLKRSYGVKDSGSILPGHGGVLDRFDGVIFAIVPLAIFVIFFKGFQG